MTSTPKPRLTHFALFCGDLPRMEDFYTRVMGLMVTDRGTATSAPVQMLFMSSDPGEHHQFVLVSGRPDDVNFQLNQQISFVVESLDELRAMRDRLLADDMEVDRCVTHGNAWSVYFKDPEGNLIEIYVHTPWHVPQPHSHAFDLSRPNEQILCETEEHCRATPGFMPRADREAEMARAMHVEG
jgi:catechol 2,3-dioxygenase